MMEVVGNILGVLIMSYAHIYSWHSLENKKINYLDYKLYVVWFLFVILLIASVSLVDMFVKIVCTTMISMSLSYYLMRCDIKRTILMSVMTQITIMLAETGLTIVLSYCGVDIDALVNLRFGGFVFNVSVSIIVVLLNVLGILPQLYRKVLKKTDKIDSQYFIAFFLAIILIANILAANVYQKLDFKYLLVFNTLITIVYFIVIIHSFSNRNNYLKVYDKYNMTLSSLKEYEDILNRYRISNHENKNQLLTIRNMIKSKEKNIPDYIDTIVENKLKDDDQLMFETLIIPEGGLRGVIYSKTLLMKSKNISFELNIDKAIKTVELIELGEDTMWHICQIMGVFLDNAIEAVEGLEDKFIDLEMMTEGSELYISVTNNFKETIDLVRMEDMGFTTKNGSHGYGLALVKELIESNNLLEHKKKISNDEFTQELIIDIKKLGS